MMRLRPLTGTPTEPALTTPSLTTRASATPDPAIVPVSAAPPITRSHTMQAPAPTTQAFTNLAPTTPAPASLSPLLNSLYHPGCQQNTCYHEL